MELKQIVHSGAVAKDISTTDPRVIRFIASDETPDRDGDIIDVAGWNIDQFMKNPVFMWSHNYNMPPIGKVVNCFKDLRTKQLLVDVRFPSTSELCPDGNISEHAKFVDTIYNLYKGKYLNAVSVGCRYVTFMPRDDGEQASMDMYARGLHVTQAELWELSGCAIPSNPSALQTASKLPGVEKNALELVMKSIAKAAIPFKHYPIADDDVEWDAAKVVAESEVPDLKIICAWYDDTKADEDLTKGDFKLPHHLTKADGYKTVKRGVIAAVGALRGARGGVELPEKDIAGVEAHLKKHYDELELAWPDSKEAWVEQAKAVGLIEKEGRRLSAATLAQIDDLESGIKEMDEAIMAIQKCRDSFAAKIQALKDGTQEEPAPDDISIDDGDILEVAD